MGSRVAWGMVLLAVDLSNAGAALVPLAVSASVAHYGWRAALYVPAASAFAIACALAVFLHGSPADVHHAADRRAGNQPLSDSTGKQPKLPRGLTRMLTQQVLLNPALWLMALSYFCVSMIRTTVSDWSTVFLHESKGLPLAVAARCLFAME